MKKLLPKKILSILILIVLSLAITQVVWGAENIEKALKGGETAIFEAFGGGEEFDLYGGETGDPFVYGLFQIINSILTFVGVIFFLILIYAGYLWMFARGNEDQVLKAKKITREVIIGIIIIVLARIITEFILIQIGASLKASSIAI